MAWRGFVRNVSGGSDIVDMQVSGQGPTSKVSVSP